MFGVVREGASRGLWDGVDVPTLVSGPQFADPKVSPDGKSLAFTRDGALCIAAWEIVGSYCRYAITAL